MKNFKVSMINLIVVLFFGIIKTPVMAATTLNLVNSESGLRMTITNYIGREDVSYFDYDVDYDWNPELITPMKPFVVKQSVDGALLKLIVDTDLFPNAHSIQFMVGGSKYYDNFGVYSDMGVNDAGVKLFPAKKSKYEEFILTLDESGFIPGGGYPLLSVALNILDENEEHIYSVWDLDFLVLEEIGNEKMPTSIPQTSTKGISIEINGEKIPSDINPIQENGLTLVPLRVISENLRANVDYNKGTQEITLTKDGHEIKLKIGSKISSTNGIKTSLSSAPKLISGSTFVPIRMIAEAFNCDVQWDGNSQKVIITEK